MRSWRIRILTPLAYSVALLLSVGTPARAGLEEGKAAYERGDFGSALREFATAADQGNPEAQVDLGKMYMQGRGTSKDIAQAIHWYHAAAAQGNSEGQFFLGGLYLMGGPISKDVPQGLKWLSLAAEQGLPDAEVLLGITYLKGQDVPRDLIQADVFLRRAAAHGDPLAPRMLHSAEKQMTAEQIGTAKDLAAAWKPKPSISAAANPKE